MGKYHGSPWGFVLGKIGDAVGGVWKGVDWVRVRIDPTQRGTYPNYLLYKAGSIPIEQFSYPQFNLRRVAVSPLGFVARTNLTNWINPIWTALADSRHLALTGTNLFIKEALPAFFASMPDKTDEFNAATNSPDLETLKVSDGDLEPIESILTAEYTTGTGALVATFGDGHFGNGSASDNVKWLVMRRPLVDGTFGPTLSAYGSMITGFPVLRSAGTITIDLPVGLDPDDLVLYLFCYDVATALGYSSSKALQVTAPV